MDPLRFCKLHLGSNPACGATAAKCTALASIAGQSCCSPGVPTVRFVSGNEDQHDAEPNLNLMEKKNGLTREQ